MMRVLRVKNTIFSLAFVCVMEIVEFLWGRGDKICIFRQFFVGIS